MSKVERLKAQIVSVHVDANRMKDQFDYDSMADCHRIIDELEDELDHVYSDIND